MRRSQRNEMCNRREISHIVYDGEEGQFNEHEAIIDELDLSLRDYRSHLSQTAAVIVTAFHVITLGCGLEKSDRRPTGLERT